MNEDAISMIDPRPRSAFKFTQEEYDLHQSGVEIWRDIELWEGMYQISTFGNIKSLSRQIWGGRSYRTSKEIILKRKLNEFGYCIVMLQKDYKFKMNKVHRLSGLAFLHNLENKKDINHGDGVRDNNFLYNLEWATRSENKLHGFRIGMTKPTCLGRFGKDHAGSKPIFKINLNNGTVIERYEALMDASRKCSIDFSQISACALGKRKQAGGYKWKYECDLVSLPQIKK